MNTAARDLRIDNTKGILIILVVIGHFLLPLPETRFITNSKYLIYSFHMPCFVFLSGYLAKNMYRGKGTFRADKLCRIIWLYFLFKLAVHVTEGLLAGHIGRRIDFFHESGAPWYLLALILWYLFIPLFFRLGQSRQGKLLAAALVLLTGLAGGYAGKFQDFLALDRVLAFAPFFYAGYFLSGKGLKRIYSGKMRAGLIAAAIVTASVIFLGTYDLFSEYRLAVYGAMYNRFSPELYPYCWLIRLVCYAAAAAISLGLLAAAPGKRVLLLSTLGERTLPVYVLHRLIRDLWQYAGLHQLINHHSKLQVLTLMAGCVLLSALLAAAPVNRAFEWLSSLPFSLVNRYRLIR